MRRRWVLTSLTDVQVNKKADVAAVTLSLKSRKQPEPINQGNHQPTLVAISMTSHLRHQPNDRVDLPIMQISPPSPGQAPQPASAALLRGAHLWTLFDHPHTKVPPGDCLVQCPWFIVSHKNEDEEKPAPCFSDYNNWALHIAFDAQTVTVSVLISGMPTLRSTWSSASPVSYSGSELAGHSGHCKSCPEEISLACSWLKRFGGLVGRLALQMDQARPRFPGDTVLSQGVWILPWAFSTWSLHSTLLWRQWTRLRGGETLNWTDGSRRYSRYVLAPVMQQC